MEFRILGPLQVVGDDARPADDERSARTAADELGEIAAGHDSTALAAAAKCARGAVQLAGALRSRRRAVRGALT